MISSSNLSRPARVISVFCLAAIALASGPAFGQLTKEQLDKVRSQRTKGITYAGTSTAKSPTRHLHSTIIEPVAIENAAARDAFKWWSTSTGIPLVMSWRALENNGVDPDTLININLRSAPAGTVLSLMMQQLSDEVELMYETTPYYIRILTKEQARKETTVRVYDIKDLIKRTPSFDSPPSFDINQALSNTSSGGSSGGAATASTNIFGETQDAEQEKPESERGEDLAQLIRELIEPEIWQAFGGQHSSVKYFNGRLIIKAPRYVHAQIGIPAVTTGRRSSSSSSRYSFIPLKKSDSKVAGVSKPVGVVSAVR